MWSPPPPKKSKNKYCFFVLLTAVISQLVAINLSSGVLNDRSTVSCFKQRKNVSTSSSWVYIYIQYIYTSFFSFCCMNVTLKLSWYLLIMPIIIIIVYPYFRLWSHFILGGLNYYVLTSKNKYNVLIVFILYCKALLLLWGGIRSVMGITAL